jgi:hypothetical protein
MAPTKSKKPTPQAEASEQPAEPLYPSIESMVERAGPDEIEHFFDSIREGMEELKGARAEQGKKVEKAIQLTEELLLYLLDVRKKLEEEKFGGKKKR